MSLRPHCDNCLVKLGSVRTSKIIIDDEETMSVGVAISTLYETLVGHIPLKSPLGEREQPDLLLCAGCGEVLSQLLNCTLTLFRRMKEDSGVRKRVGELRGKILKKGEEQVNNVEEEQEVIDIPADDDDGCGGLSDGGDDDVDFIPSEAEDGDSDYDDKNKKKDLSPIQNKATKGSDSVSNKNQGSSSSSPSTSTSSKPKPRPTSSSTSSVPVTEYQCPQCPKHFKNLLPFYKHQQAHKEGKLVGTTGHRVRSEDTSEKMKVKIPCTHPDCDKILQRRHLLEHLKSHNEARPYLCPSCGRSYKTSSNLRVHEKSHSLPFSCTKCPKRFGRAAVLKQHIETIHEFKEPVLCTICGKQFIHERNLKEHMKIHDESAEQLCCNLCNKMFSRTYNLRAHIKSVHEGVKYVKKSEGSGAPRNVVSKFKRNEEDVGAVTHSHSSHNYGYVNYSFQY